MGLSGRDWAGVAAVAAAHGTTPTPRRLMTILGAMILSCSMAGCALIFPPIPNFRTSGLKFDDEFDRPLVNVRLVCIDPSWINVRADAAGTRLFHCKNTDQLLKVLLKKQAEGTPIKDFLRSKGGTCTEVGGGASRCIVEREVTAANYLGDEMQGQPRRILLKVKVDLRAGDVKVNIDRYDFAPGTKAGPEKARKKA